MSREALLQQFPDGVQLRGDVLVLETDESIAFAREKSVSIKTKVMSERLALKQLREGVAVSDLKQWTENPRILKMFSLLNAQSYFKPMVKPQNGGAALSRQLDWLSHFSNSPVEVQAQLSGKSVLILGCGGTGSIIAEHLVRAGVTRLALVDHGLVDMPDMNRQLAYLQDDCGLKKVNVLSERLKKINSDLKVQVYDRQIGSQSDVEEFLTAEAPDLVVNGADSPIGLIHCWVADACETFGAPVLFGGVGLMDGTLGPFLLSSAAREKYSQDMRKAQPLLNDNLNTLKASISFTNSLIAVLMAYEAFKYLSGTGSLLTENKALAFNFFSLGQEVQWSA